MRERLTEILNKTFEEQYEKRGLLTANHTADYLLENGVIVLPYEIGTKVYVITSATINGKNLYIFEDVITHYQIETGYMVMGFYNHIGEPHWTWDKVFLTREEAEAALKEREKT